MTYDSLKITQVTVALLRIFVPSATEETLATAIQVRLGACTGASIQYDEVEGLLCALVQLAISPVEGSRLAERLIVLYSLFPSKTLLLLHWFLRSNSSIGTW